MVCTVLPNKTKYRSDTDVFNVSFTDSSGLPIDITGYEVRYTIRKKYPTTDVVDDTDAVVSSLATIPNGVDGIANFNITSAEMDINPIEYYYDIQYKTLDGQVITVGVARITVEYDITRDN